jgi:hypothetical protein
VTVRTSITLLLVCSSGASAQSIAPGVRAWTHLARTPWRSAAWPVPLPDIGAPGVVAWVRATDEEDNPLRFIGQAGTLVYGGSVFATARVQVAGQSDDEWRVYAFSRDTGGIQWYSPVPDANFDSFSTPAVDEANYTVIHGSGRSLTALDIENGAVVWSATLLREVVNASPVVTADRGPRDRVFITDFDGFGTEARLYCINVDPFDAALNPHQPGDIVWSTAIGGSSGNSPAYLPAEFGGEGLVFVTTVGDFGFGGGEVRAYRVDSAPDPAPEWSFTNPTGDGFFGGLCVLPPENNKSGAYLYAASYAFSGSLLSANIVKVRASDGAMVWEMPCNRTQSIPVALPGGRVLLSSGLRGFGSLPGLELFQDHGATVTRLWRTVTDSWIDADNDGQIDPDEFLDVGGWTIQPVVAAFGGTTRIAAGVTPGAATFDAASPRLYHLDLDRHPSDPAFVVSWRDGTGGSCAAAGINLYSVGTSGLTAFGPPPVSLDVDGNARLNIDDLYAWEQGQGGTDIDGNGATDSADRVLLLTAIRAGETSGAKGVSQ